MSRVTAIISALAVFTIVCLSAAVNFFITADKRGWPQLPAKRLAKMPDKLFGDPAITDMQMRQRDVAALMQNTRRS